MCAPTYKMSFIIGNTSPRPRQQEILHYYSVLLRRTDVYNCVQYDIISMTLIKCSTNFNDGIKQCRNVILVTSLTNYTSYNNISKFMNHLF